MVFGLRGAAGIARTNRSVTGQAPLFILSFRQRDELATLAASAGWQVVAARRVAGAERRFLSSGAIVAVVDARGAAREGVEAAAALSGVIEANGGAMLALVSRGEVGVITELYDAGATHFLASPMGEAEFLQALRFAARHAERMGGEWHAAVPAEPLGWRFDLKARSLLLTPGFARLLGVDEQPSQRDLLRRIEAAERHAAIAAFRRMTAARPATAFAHDLPGMGRVVQHLQYDPVAIRIDAIVESLGSAPEPASELREALAGFRDAGSARRWIAKRLAEPDEVPLFAMLVALNRFDVVNTAYGRTTGDNLLRAALKRIADVVDEALARDAFVSRMSGSAF